MKFLVVLKKSGEKPRQIFVSESETSAKQYVKKQMDLDKSIGLRGTRYSIKNGGLFS